MWYDIRLRTHGGETEAREVLMSDEAKVNGESVRDSLLDLANYAILTIMELDKTRK